MHHFSKRLFTFGLLLGAFVIVGVTGGTAAHADAAPTIRSARHYNSRIVAHANYRLWAQPYQTGVKAVGKTTSLAHKLVQLDQVATTKTGTYFNISRRGHHYGWVSGKALVKPTTYSLPFTYTSQLYPLYAPNGCESASLKMALSVKGIATGTSLKTIIERMPKSSNSNKGFNGDPYTESAKGETRTIYPKPLTAYAQTFDPQAANITGASKNQLITEIKRGNAVVVSGSWHYQTGRPYHVLALVGYRHGQFQVADPYMEKAWSNKVFWVSTSQFMRVFSSASRHSRAVVIR